jgi:hypothetical protein
MDIPVEPDVELNDLARQALEAHDRQNRRAMTYGLRVAFLLLVPLAGAVGWWTLVGYQRHVLEIETGGRVFRLVSHKGDFEITTPNEPFSKPQEGGLLNPIEEDITTDRVEARAYGQASYATTRQRARLADGLVDYQFTVNNIPFSLTRSELSSGDMHWHLEHGETREIEVDRLSPPEPQPATVNIVRDPE